MPIRIRWRWGPRHVAGGRGHFIRPCIAEAKRAKDSSEWVGHSAAMRAKLNMPPGARPWTASGASLRGISQTARILDLLDVAWFASTRGLSKGEVDEVRGSLMVDISQGVERTPWKLQFGTITTTSEFYSYGLDRNITDFEKFQGLGFNLDTDFRGLSVVALRDLVGEAMALPSVGTMLQAMVLGIRYPGLWENDD